MSMQRHEVTKQPTLTSEQQERLAKLEAMPDSDIDYSDIPAGTDWTGAIRGSVVPSHKNVHLMTQSNHQVLDTDLVQWLANQDDKTKRHVNEVIRHIMIMQQD